MVTKRLATAYAVAGAVVTASVVAVAGATVGLGGLRGEEVEAVAVTTQDAAAIDQALASGAATSEVVRARDGSLVEYVYVDAPAQGHEGDGEHEDREHEEREHEGRTHEEREHEGRSRDSLSLLGRLFNHEGHDDDD